MYCIKTKRTNTLQFLEETIHHHQQQQQQQQQRISPRNPTNTTIIICSSKIEFYSQLATCITTHEDHNAVERNDIQEIPASQEDIEHDDDNIDNNEKMDMNTNPDYNDNTVDRIDDGHPFLHPTLDLLSTSRNIKLVFCPSIPVLRALVSIYAFDVDTSKPKPELGPNTKSKSRQLKVVDLLALHKDTSEFTVQGLSRTLAAIVSMAHRNDARLEMRELYHHHHHHHHQIVDARDSTEAIADSNHGSTLWDSSVPLLSGSVRISAAGTNWAAGRAIPVRKVAGRWFQFDE